MKYAKLFDLFNSEEKKSLFYLFLLMLLSTLLEIFGLSLILPIIGLSMGSEGTNYLILNYLSNLFNIKPNQLFIFLIYFFISFQVLKLLFVIWYNWFENNYLYSFKERISSKILQIYLSQNLNFFFLHNSSNLLRNMTYSVDQCSVFLFSFLKISLDFLMLISIFIFLFLYNPYITLIIAISFMLLSLIYILSLKDKLENYGVLRHIHNGKRLQFFQESIDNIKYIKITGTEKFFFEKFKTHNLAIKKTSIPAEFFKSLPRPILEILSVVIIMILLLYFTQFQSNSTVIMFETLGLFLAAAFRLMPSFSRILTSLQSLKNTFPEIQVLTNEFKRQKKEANEYSSNLKLKENILVDIKKFSYEDEKKFELSDIYFNIKKGDKIGIVGESGSGKSTIIDLITGVIKPKQGNINIDKKSIYSDLKGWQKIIGYVPQKITIIEDTLENNILFGMTADKKLKTKVLDLISKTNLTALQRADKQTFSSLITEKGKNISGGEMQRIAICRALLRDPEVLILDEATSSLDLKTEEQILNMIDSLYSKTVVFVSHKMNSLKFCNKIYKVFDGKLEPISIEKN